MTKGFLEQCLAEGLSLERIGELVDRHPSTVSYHLRKHGLLPVNHDLNRPRGSAVAKDHLERLLAEGSSLREIAAELELSVSSVRYWMNKHGLEPSRVGRARRESAAARRAGLSRIEKECPRHGLTTFVLETRGYYRCLRCRSEAVANRRRRAKQELVDASGGRCAICGYDRYAGAQQFHHLDPETKSFAISGGGATRARAKLATEAEKCVLLCANCHAELEAGIVELPDELWPLQ